MKTRRLTGILTACLSCLCLLAVWLLPVRAEELPEPTADFYVNDYAGIFTEQQRTELLEAARALDRETTAQLVILTVKTTGGQEISEYALEVGRNWGIGSKDKDNGVLLVLATEGRTVYVSVGYGLEGALPDSKVGRLLDQYAMPSYRENNFADGTSRMFWVLNNEIRAEYGVGTAAVPDAIAAAETTGKGMSGSAAFGLVALFVIGFLVALYLGIALLIIVCRMLWRVGKCLYYLLSGKREQAREYAREYLTGKAILLMVLSAVLFAVTATSGVVGTGPKDRDPRRGGSGRARGGSSGSSGGGGSFGGGGAGRKF